MSTPRFGVSTHLFHAARLDREHLVEIAAHDFETVEVFATKTHFDYHDPAAIAQLGEWLAGGRPMDGYREAEVLEYENYVLKRSDNLAAKHPGALRFDLVFS